MGHSENWMILKKTGRCASRIYYVQRTMLFLKGKLWYRLLEACGGNTYKISFMDIKMIFFAGRNSTGLNQHIKACRKEHSTIMIFARGKE